MSATKGPDRMTAAEYRAKLAGPKPKRRVKNRPEQHLQVSCIGYSRAATPSIVIFAVPNGYKKTRTEAGIARDMGQEAGVWDLVAVLPQGGILFIEMKAPGAKSAEDNLSEAQKTFRKRAEPWGAYFEPCDSLDRYIAILHEYWPSVLHGARRLPSGVIQRKVRG